MTGKPTLTPLDAKIGEKVKRLREGRGMSQAQIGEIIGLGSSAVSMMERGERAWAVKHLYAIAVHFNIPVAEFFDAVEMSPDERKIYDSMKELLTLQLQTPVPSKKKGQP